jgi:hypothetical protein
MCGCKTKPVKQGIARRASILFPRSTSLKNDCDDRESRIRKPGINLDHAKARVIGVNRSYLNGEAWMRPARFNAFETGKGLAPMATAAYHNKSNSPRVTAGRNDYKKLMLGSLATAADPHTIAPKLR